jgi:hypothetical protein
MVTLWDLVRLEDFELSISVNALHEQERIAFHESGHAVLIFRCKASTLTMARPRSATVEPPSGTLPLAAEREKTRDPGRPVHGS